MKVFARTPLNLEKFSQPQGEIYLIPERCKECEFCVRFCPKQVLQVSQATNSKGYHYPEIAEGKESACVHCEFCTLVCPEFAIFTIAVNGSPSAGPERSVRNTGHERSMSNVNTDQGVRT